jgi:hypothetical protein
MDGTEQAESTYVGAPVSGRAPIGFLPVDAGPIGLNVWECALCFALIADVGRHGLFHAANPAVAAAGSGGEAKSE